MMMKHVMAAAASAAILAMVVPAVLPLSALAASASGSSSSGSSASSGPSNPSTPPDNPGQPNGGPGGGDPGLPAPPTPEQVSQLEQLCNAALNRLAKVPPKLVVAFANEAGVSVVPVCNSGAGHQAKIDPSQALPLQHAIANNPALMAVLKLHGFHAEDVVGVVMTDGVATLYVHLGAA